MANCAVTYAEVRFKTRDPNITEMYVLCEASGDCPHTVHGWHYKAFPASCTVLDIMNAWNSGQQDMDPILWPLKAP